MSAPRLDVPEGAPTECPGTQSEAAGKSSACDGCPNQAVCASGEAAKPDPVTSLVQARLSSVKHTILVLSGKGGVGKSTVSSQLAFTLASKGFQVGLLDVDICGPSIPRMLGLEGREVHQSAAGWSPVWLEDNLGVMSIGFMLPDKDDAIIWRGPKKNGLIKQFLTDVDWGDLDFLIVDTPPGTSDEHISIVQYLKGSVIAGAVVVTTPQEVAMMDVRKEINFCQKTGVPVLGVVENMSGFVCPGCKELHHIFPQSGAGPAGMAARYGVAFLGKIPLDPVMLTSCEKGESYVTSYPDAPGVKPLLSVVHAILAAVGEPETAPAAAHAMDTRE